MLPVNQRFLTTTSPGVDGPSSNSIYVTPTPGAPEVRFRDPLHGHLADVAAVENYVDLPQEWLAIRERWTRLVGISFPCRDLLSAAVVTGQGDDITTLHALALAEVAATSGTGAEVRLHVGAAVQAALATIYTPHARPVYRTIADVFNDAADDHRRTELLPVLLAAARLCGANPDIGNHAEHQLGVALTIDPQRAHKRRLLEAFPRWQTLRDLGARIKASADPLVGAWQLPDVVRVFDPNRVLREWDPLDGLLPAGWTGSVEGWLEQGGPQLWA